ncbi:MAG: carbon storage regulator CsrA [Pirellulales bacterium]|nr:carbon storage regulator CsrA [Pirellulales bacterium]
MLVLSRKANEKIQIGDGITVTVLRIKGNQIKLGIEAPRDVRVIRSELPPREMMVTDADVAEEVESELIEMSELAEMFVVAGAQEQADAPAGKAGSARGTGRLSLPRRERKVSEFAPATSPRWSSTNRRPGSTPLASHVSVTLSSRLGAQL